MANGFISGRKNILQKLKNMTLQSEEPETGKQFFEDPETLTKWIYMECPAEREEDCYEVMLRLPAESPVEMGRVALESETPEEIIVTSILLAQRFPEVFANGMLKELQKKIPEIWLGSEQQLKDQRLELLMQPHCLEALGAEERTQQLLQPLTEEIKKHLN